MAKALKPRNPMTIKKLMAKRLPGSRASTEEQKKFAEMFGPELVITLPGLSQPIISPPNYTDEEEEK